MSEEGAAVVWQHAVNETVVSKTQNAQVSLQEQLQQVDDLTRIVREHPELFCQRDDAGLLPCCMSTFPTTFHSK
jgi:hypothetical protein